MLRACVWTLSRSESLIEAFREMDKNGDGLLQYEEFEEAIVKMAVKDPDTFAEFLNQNLLKA